jgi:hypothetical protein
VGASARRQTLGLLALDRIVSLSHLVAKRGLFSREVGFDLDNGHRQPSQSGPKSAINGTLVPLSLVCPTEQ